MKKVIITLSLFAFITVMAAQSNRDYDIQIIIKDTAINDIEKLDLVLLDKYAKVYQQKDANGSYFEYDLTFTEDGIKTRINGDTRHGFVVEQTLPRQAFFKILKTYYPNGYLKMKGKLLGGGLTIVGEWEFYDENGQLTHVVNEDKKFGKFGYYELLLFLYQQGYIDLETGENRGVANFVYNVEKKQWTVDVFVGTWYSFTIDGETGEVLSKKGLR